MLTLATELSHIRGVNKRLLGGLKKLGIVTVRDLLWHLPFRYDDFSSTVPIENLEPGQTATICGEIKTIEMRRTWQRRMILVEAMIADQTGAIRAVWFNQPYLVQNLPVGTVGNFAGKITHSNGSLYLSNPIYEPLGTEAKHTGGLIPIYPETRGLTSRGIRYLIKPILQNLPPIPDAIPKAALTAAQLFDLDSALRAIHFPKTLEHADLARRRLAFEDLFLLQLKNLRIKLQLAQEPAVSLPWEPAERNALFTSLPFTLTTSQKQSVDEILNDIQRGSPMNRLLQGDVGSGKTVVVAIAALLAAKHNYQTAILAPTEVLARQHYQTFIKLFGTIIHDWQLNLALLSSADARCFYGDDLETAIPKARLTKQIGEGHLKIAIGTHALIQKSVSFPRLAFIVVDEQHRFGVEQRAALSKNKRRTVPHFLSMSATPIPRTLSLTIFGDLDISIIDELPSGRRPIITKIVAPANRLKAYTFIRSQVKKGRQVFVICPRIEETEPENSTPHISNLWEDVKAVKKEYEKLSQEIFPDLTVAMLHGKLKNTEKTNIMREFTENKINILVATSVIEVGVDVPNATIMVIEDADRFGLAQLYQFRGRVGRGAHQSVCLLFTKSTSAGAHQRLKSLLEAKNGFELAEKDLAIRGPGEFLGQSQTGMPDLAMRSLNNMELVKKARHAALAVLSEDPALQRHPLLRERLSTFQKAVHLEQIPIISSAENTSPRHSKESLRPPREGSSQAQIRPPSPALC